MPKYKVVARPPLPGDYTRQVAGIHMVNGTGYTEKPGVAAWFGGRGFEVSEVEESKPKKETAKK